MDKFVLTAQMQMKAPNNLQQVVRHVKNSFSDIVTHVRIKTDVKALKGAEQDLKRLRLEAEKTSSVYNEIGGILANAARRFAGISIATGTFLGLARAIKGGIGDAITFEKEITKMAQATETSIHSAKRLGKEISEVSIKYGTASNELVKFARVFAQAGFTAKQTSASLNLLAQTDLIGTFGEMESTAEGIITTLAVFSNQVRGSAADISFLEKSFDSINRVAKKYAIESEDIVTAVRKTGAVFQSAGGDLDELNALMTSVRATTRESADTIANGFKTIFTRLQKTDTLDSLQQLGINLEDTEGKFIGPYKAIQKLSIALSGLPDGSRLKNSILEQIGGVYQIGRLIPLVKNYTMQQEILNESQKASGDIAKDVALQQQILGTKINQTKESFAALIRQLYESETFKSAAKFALEFANAAIKLAGALEGLIPYLTAYFSISATKIAYSATRSFFGGGSKSKSKPNSTARTLLGSTEVGGMAEGGFVGGKPGIDKNLAWLSKDEFVVKGKVASKNAGFLEAFNNDKIPKLNNGGFPKSGASNRKNISAEMQDLLDAQGATNPLYADQIALEKSYKKMDDEIQSKAFVGPPKPPRPKKTSAHVKAQSVLSPEMYEQVIGGQNVTPKQKKNVGVMGSDFQDMVQAQSGIERATSPKISSPGRLSQPPPDRGFLARELDKEEGLRANKQGEKSEKVRAKAVNTPRTESLEKAYSSSGLNAPDNARQKALNAAYDSVGLTAKNLNGSAESLANSYIEQKTFFDKSLASQKDMPDAQLGLVTSLQQYQRAVDETKAKFGKVNPLLDSEISGNAGPKVKVKSSAEISKEFEEGKAKAAKEKDIVHIVENLKNQPGGPNGPNGPKGPNGPSGPGSPSGPNNPNGPNGPNGPRRYSIKKPESPQNDEVAASSNKLAIAFPILAVGLLATIDRFKLLDEANSQAVKSAFAMGGIFYSISKTALPAFANVLSETKPLINKFASLTQSSAVATKANIAATASENAETAANKRSAASEGKADGAGKLILGINLLAGAIAVVAGVSEFFASKMESAAEALDEKVSSALKNVELSGKGNLGTIQTDARKAQENRNSASNTRSGALNGALGGAAVGAGIGLIIPVIGPLIGAAVGAAVGGAIGGYSGSQNSGLEESQRQSINNSIKAQYYAAKSAYDLGESLVRVKDKQLSAEASLDLLSKSFDKSFSDITSAKSAFVQVQFAQAGVDPTKRTDSQKKEFSDAEDADNSARKTSRQFSQELQGSASNVISKKLTKVKDVQGIEDIFNSPEIKDAIKNSITAFNISTSDEKAKETNKKDTEDLFAKQKEAATESLNVQSALNAAKKAEIELVIKVNSVLNTLAGSSLLLEKSQSNISVATGQSYGGISQNRFSDISRVGNINSFAADAQTAGSNLGPQGAAIANEITSAAVAIDQVRNSITETSLENVGATKIDAAGSQSKIRAELEKSAPEFKNLNKSIQDIVVSNLYTELTSGNIDLNSIEKITKDIADGAQKQAEILSQSNAQALQYIQQLAQINDLMLTARGKIGELSAGAIGIKETGRQRLNEVNAGRATNASITTDIQTKEKTRRNIGINNLAAAGIDKSNFGNLDKFGVESQRKLNQNKEALKNDNLSTSTRGNLVLENQKLSSAISATTTELGKLANQADRASDIMGEIQRVQAASDSFKNKATDYVTGGQEERFAMQEQFAALNNVMQTGTLQNLPQDLRKSVQELVADISKSDPNGAAAQGFNNAVLNDFKAANGGKVTKDQEAAILGQATTKEQQLINELDRLNKEEKAAQQALIAIEMENTKALNSLLGGLNAWFSKTNGQPQPAQNIPQQQQNINAPKTAQTPVLANNNLNSSLNNAVNQIPQSVGTMVGSINTFSGSVDKITQSLSNITMKHELTIDGQLKIAGIDSDQFAKTISNALGQYVANIVKVTLDKNSKQFRTA